MAWLISNALMVACESSRSLPAQAVGSSEGTCSDGAPSAPSSGTPTPQAYLWADKTTAADFGQSATRRYLEWLRLHGRR